MRLVSADVLLVSAVELSNLGKKWRARSPVLVDGDKRYLEIELQRLFRRIERFEDVESDALSPVDLAKLREAECLLDALSVLIWGY